MTATTAQPRATNQQKFLPFYHNFKFKIKVVLTIAVVPI